MLNLAISYAELNERVLLVACDLRRPKVSRLLDIHQEAGLGNVLLKPDLIRSAIVKDAISTVDIQMAGDVPLSPSELLASGRMTKLLEFLRTKYDYIILDTPPVNVVTDACVLVPESSGVLFVVCSGYSERGAVVHAVEQLEYSRAKILGFTLNGVGPESNYHGYGKNRYSYKAYGYKSYGYSYGHHSYSQRNEE